jgi:hypothetical protein
LINVAYNEKIEEAAPQELAHASEMELEFLFSEFDKPPQRAWRMHCLNVGIISSADFFTLSDTPVRGLLPGQDK